MAKFGKWFKRLRLPLPGGTIGKYGTAGKIGASFMAAPILGFVNPFSMDPDVLGARASASSLGLSVDEAKRQKVGEQREIEAQQIAAERARAETERQAADEQRTQEELARKKLRAGQTSGFASTVLTGPSGLTTAGAAGLKLYGS